MSTIENTLHGLVEEIGPRPASSDSERTAAEFIAREFEDMGLPVDIQDFATSTSFRTVSIVLYLVIGLCILGIGYFSKLAWLNWTLWVVLLLAAAISWLEANGKPVLTSRLHKGPSQNVVATFTPSSRSTEGTTKRIVVMANYDTCLVPPVSIPSSLMRLLATINTYIIYSLPVLALAIVFKPKFMVSARVWVWYLLLVLAAVPVLFAINLLITSLVKRYSPGANNNASGVAAVLEVASLLIGGKLDTSTARKTQRSHTSKFEKQQTTSEPFWTPADESVKVNTDSDFPEDFSWAGGSKTERGKTGAIPIAAPSQSTGGKPAARRTADAALPRFDTLDFDMVPEAADQPTVSFAPVRGENAPLDSEHSSETVLGRDLVGDVRRRSDRRKDNEKKSIFSGLFSKKGSSRSRHKDSASSSDWLGLENDFDARSAGKDIGSWDNFDSDDDDDGFAWKGGAAGGDFIADPSFAANEAMRIRLKVSEQFDLQLDGKEIWFVATGSRYALNAGIKELLDAYPTELRNAFFINIDGVGAGDLYWRTGEGRIRLRKASVRLTSLARRATRDEEILAKGVMHTGVETDATAVLRGGGKAITITRLDTKGNTPNSFSMNDTLATVDSSAIEETARFVAAMVRGA